MNAKKIAAEHSLEFVKEGMAIGLGTGSTVYWAILRLAEMVKDGFRIRAIPTSRTTRTLALELGIPLTTFAEVSELDLTIDGADEVNPHLDLIKGGGGALLREKLVALASRQLVIVADSTKRVSALGQFPLPVEVVPFAWENTARRVAGLNCAPSIRLKDGKPLITDNGNYILDCTCGKIDSPAELDRELKSLSGVIETGLFVSLTDIAIIASEGKVDVLRRK